MDIAKLPPKPDLRTGEPRPPSAPLEPGNKQTLDRKREGRRKVPEAPEGEGALLEWFYPSRGSRFVGGLIVPILGVGLYTWQEGGFGWANELWLWLILLPWPFLGLWFGKFEVSAGADWVASRKVFVKTYELVSVKVGVVSGGAAHELQIKDKHGRSARYKVNELQQNHELWDLVYNGLIHSVHVNGAETNKRARDYLFLDYPPTATDA